MRTSFVRALCEVARDDPRIWLLTGDLGYSVLEPFAESFPDRYVNVGVAEQNMTGVAAGLAHSGKIVFTYSIANFPTLRCLEQIRNDVCYHRLDVKVIAVGGGFTYGSQGYTHHGLEDIGILRTLPGMTVVAPGDPVETRQAVVALVATPGPAYMRLGKAGEPVVHATEPSFALGRAIALREGFDFALFSTGGMLAHCVETADCLNQQYELRGRVLSMHTVKPLDRAAVLTAATETPLIVTAEEHSVVNGLGSAVSELVAEMTGPHAKVRRFGAPDEISSVVGTQSFLRSRFGSLGQVIVDGLRD